MTKIPFCLYFDNNIAEGCFLMDKRFIRLSFIKTFVNTSKVVMENLDIEEARDVRYWRIAKDLAELYPTLQLMAEELNED